jgi:hypothetical protein
MGSKLENGAAARIEPYARIARVQVARVSQPFLP